MLADISNFKYHMAHHGTDRPWECNECPKNYKTKIDLLQHQRVHDKARDPFHCELCGQYFRTRSNYNTHQRTHNTKGPQNCSLCDKVFVNLRSHVQMVHQKVRHHVCGICSKAFGKKSGLDRHVITVHEKQRCWNCDLCDKNFGEKGQLLRHRKVHFKPAFQEPDPAQVTDDQIIVDNKKKRMMCGICKKVLNSRAALNRHKLLVHEKKRDLLCDFCPQMFGEKSNLMRHIQKSHTIEVNSNEFKEITDESVKRKTDPDKKKESLQCRSCDKVLTTEWGLKSHEDVCLINQQKKLNNIEHKSEDLNESYETNGMEQVFLVTSSGIQIKQEPPFLEQGFSNDSFEKFVPEMSQSETLEPIEISIKDEIIEEYIEDEDDSIEMLEIDRYSEEEGEEEDHIIYDDSEIVKPDDQCFEDEENALMESENSKQRYKCRLCTSTFKEKRYFQSHMRTVHSKKKSLKCTVIGCEEVFVYRVQRLRHLRQKHPEVYEESDTEENVSKDLDEAIECELCDLAFESKEAIEDHLEKDHDENEDEDDEKKRTCESCQPRKVFKKTRYLLLHIQAVHSDQTFQCTECPKSFSFRCSLGRHVRGVHKNIRDHKCDESECDKMFRNSYDLKQHKICAHNKGDKSDRTCKICMKVFKKVQYMEIHFASIHNTEPQFSCPICHRGFSFQRSMDRHIRAIHEDRRDYKCMFNGCEKAFRSRYDLNEHFNNIHAEFKKTRPVEEVTCDVCEKICSSRKVLYSHKKIVHEGIRWGTNFECKLCKEVFESKYKKSKHWGQVHRNGKVKTRTCYLCSSEFQLFNDFKQHIESHTGCFICIICGYNFSDESSLFVHHESHRKIEESLRQYVCDVCSHRLSTKHQLLIHMRKHFPGDYYMCDVSFVTIITRRCLLI